MKKSILICFSLCCSFYLFGQTYNDLYQKGLKYRNEFKYVEALATFQVLLKTDSSNVDYLYNASIMYAKQGNIFADEKKKMEYYRTAEYLALKAIAINRKSAESHYAYALSLGRLNENASSKQKIANAKMIKSEADTTVILSPDNAGAYHILGRWHRTIAGFNVFEKLAINSLFGGVPEGGSYDAAIAAFKNAIKYEPLYILHYYELAVTYHERNASSNDKNEAITILKKAITMKLLTPDDPETLKKCHELLKKLGG